MVDLPTGNELLLTLTIPVVSAVVGWGTNALALKMMFKPPEFRGIPPYLGWQGVIPANAMKMGRIASETLANHLIKPEALLEKLDADEVARELEPALTRLTEPILEEVLEEQMPGVWSRIPPPLQEATRQRVVDALPAEISALIEEVRGQLGDLVDVQAISEASFSEQKELVPELFMRCGHREFLFIERSGGLFGFLFGLIQMGAWLLWPAWWMLPTAGVLVGYVTNSLALKMIFEPAEPRSFGLFTWQGLFLKRQKEVSREYAEVFARKVLTPSRIADHVIKGPASFRLAMLLQPHLLSAIDEAIEPNEALVNQFTSPEQQEALRHALVNRLMARGPEALPDTYDYAAKALDIESEIRTNLEALPPSRFEQILRPIFQEDEWILIATGAALGAIAGVVQASFLVPGF